MPLESKIKKDAFFYPKKSINSSSMSPTDIINNDLYSANNADKSYINYTEGIHENFSQCSSINRPGNNQDSNSIVEKYSNQTGINYGPFNIYVQRE